DRGRISNVDIHPAHIGAAKRVSRVEINAVTVISERASEWHAGMTMEPLRMSVCHEHPSQLSPLHSILSQECHQPRQECLQTARLPSWERGESVSAPAEDDE